MGELPGEAASPIDLDGEDGAASADASNVAAASDAEPHGKKSSMMESLWGMFKKDPKL
jgi:hypothetical protein